MKITLLTLSIAISLSFCLTAAAQDKGILKKHPNRYRLCLPEEWMKPKMIRAVTDILPRTISQLEGKDFCTDGLASYYVLLQADSLKQFDNGFSFWAALRIYDSTGTAIADLRLVSPDEVFNGKVSSVIYQSNFNRTAHNWEVIFDHKGNVVQRIPIPLPEMAISTNILEVFDLDLFEICKSRLLEIRNFLKNHD